MVPPHYVENSPPQAHVHNAVNLCRPPHETLCCLSLQWGLKIVAPFVSAVGARFEEAKLLYTTYLAFGSPFSYAIGDSIMYLHS